MKSMEWIIAAGLVLLAWKMWSGAGGNTIKGASMDAAGNYYMDGKMVWSASRGAV